MNQSRHAIWSRHQRRERGHQVTPHSLILTRFPLLFSSPLLIFSYPSFLVSSFFFSWCCFVLCYFFCCRFNHIFFHLLLCFVSFFLHVPHLPMFLLFFLFRVRHHSSNNTSATIASSLPLWLSLIASQWHREEGAPPSLVVPQLSHRLEARSSRFSSTLILKCRLAELSWRGFNPTLKKQQQQLLSTPLFLIHTPFFILGLAQFCNIWNKIETLFTPSF